MKKAVFRVPPFLFPSLLLMIALLATIRPAAQDPPLAEKIPRIMRQHGVEWKDDYFWLRNREEPKVKAYLEAENAYLEKSMAPLKSLREALVKEMKARIIEEDVSVPYRKGPWLYYSRDAAGKDHSVLCRKPYLPDHPESLLEPAPPGAELILLDLNERAGGDEAFTFGGAAISPDHRLYAWKENHDGTDIFTIRFKNLETGEILQEEVEGAVFEGSLVWALDGKTIFFTEGDETDRPWRVKSHTLGNPPKEAGIVYEELDTRFSLEIGATKSQRFLVITSGSKDTTETSLVPLDRPSEKPQVFLPRREGLRYSLADCGENWFLVTNEGAVNGRVFKTPLTNKARDSWVEVLPGDEQIAYGGIDAFASHVVIGARKNGVPGFFILDPDRGTTRWVSAPGEGASLQGEYSPEYDSTAQRFSYDTFLQPYAVAEVELATGEIRLLKQKASPPGYDPAKYRVERTFSTSPDGTKIPLWLLLPAHFPRDGSGAILLDGYGAYGFASDPWFDSDVFSLIDRGVGYALAQIRGGGEFGRIWYEAGKLENKETSFTDFIACAEHLVAEGYTSPTRLCGVGASAGGLLAGAVLNRRPDLFKAYVANVPFVDVLNTMLDASLPLTTGEYDEWGNPEASREVFDRIRAYSPYENVKAQDYPAILVLAGWNDNRVAYWEPAKWVAKMRVFNTGKAPVLLHTAFETGHGGSSGRYSALDEIALQYAFILDQLGRATP